MEFSRCLNDGNFGPGVEGCRDDFDFTLKFEKIFLSILPCAIFIALSITRTALLARWPKVVGGNWFQVVKLASLGIYAVLQLPLLALSVKAGRLQAVFVASSALCFIASLCMCVLSFWEHSRTPRPSMLLNGFLFLTLLFDIAQTRSLWLSAGSYDGRTYTRLFTATIAIKALIILLESVHKKRWLDWDSKDHSPEETAGLYGLGAFLWLNSLFLRGYNKILTLKDLYPLDQHMLAVKLEAALTQRVEVANWGGKPHALTKTLFRTLAAAYLLPVGPRIALMGFQLCQPFLIQSLLDHLAQTDGGNSSNIGKGLIGAAILIYGGIAVSTAFYWYFQERAMYMARGSLAAAIYKKSTLARLDAADDSAAVTLMSTDVEKIRVGLLFLHEFWVNIIQAAIASWLLYRILGAAFVASIILVFICLAFSFLMARAASPTQKAWMERIQKRVGLTANVITNMKHLKISGLTVPVEASIQVLRHEELKAGGKFRMIQALTAILGQVPLSLAPVFTFAVTSRTLDVTTIFTSMSYLVLLATPLSFVLQLVPTFMAGLACLNRIQAFLEKEARTDFREFPEQPGTTEKHLSTTGSDTIRPAVQIVDGSFGWADGMFNLKNISASIPSQGLTIVVGPIASGKSTFCKALLGETPLHQGRVIMGKSFRKIGYCDQTPFLSNATIRENIIGFSPFNEARYRDVIDATQLTRDLTLFPQGDKTNVGSNGITLSGGQKQRVSIARALYTEADLLIFDDILSGLDADTEEQVFSRVFGPLGMLKQRDATVVLCTHSVRHMPAADHIIALSSEGTLVEEGNFVDLMANQKYVHSLGVKASEASEEGGSGASTPPMVEKVEASFDITRTATGHTTQHDTDDADDPAQKSRATGDMAVYSHYARSIGYSWISIFFLAGLLSGFFYNFPTVWLKFWAEDVGASAHPDHTNAYYIGLYSLFQVLTLIFFGLMLIICLKFMIQVSGAALHTGLLAAVMTAPLSFFTQTDSGVVTNLFSQDMTIIDGELPISLINVVLDGFTTLGQAAIIATSSPWLAVSYPFLFGAIFGIQKFYLRTSRQLRLLDLEAKSPLYTHFLDTIKGLATFRAFAWTQASIAENNKLLDTSQRPAYLLAMIQRWLLFVLNVVVAFLAVIVVTLATQLRANSGFTGASLVSIMSFGDMLANIVRMYTTLETSIGAVSRLKSFTENTKPEDLPGEDVVPPDTWPSRGTIEIRNISASYGDPQSVSVLDTKSSEPGNSHALALRDLNLVIQPGEKVAICGRSGSGKSSTILLLLRLLDPVNTDSSSPSSITIDSLPLDIIDRTTLRRRIIAVPQDAVFLPDGTSFRENLDPFNVSTQEDCRAVLEAVELWPFISDRGGLEAGMISDSLSQGQKQLFSLARAMLRARVRAATLASSDDEEKGKGSGGVLLLDEVSSSVDVDTDRAMQRIIMREFEGYTIVMVSHRLDMVMGFDKVVVMDAGRVVEQGPPRELVQVEGGRFRELWGVGNQHVLEE